MNIIKYTEFGLDLDCIAENEQVWMSVSQIAELFGISERTCREHIQHILDDKELDKSTRRLNRQVRNEGEREVSRDVVHCSQDMVMHIGYRVRSDRGVHFRKWATKTINQALDPKPQSCVDPIVAMLQAALETRKDLLALQTTVTELSEANEARNLKEKEALAQLYMFPEPTVTCPVITDRAILVDFVRAHSVVTGIHCGTLWKILYCKIRILAKFDCVKRSKNSNLCPLDILEKEERLAEAYAIAKKIFVIGEEK